MATVRLLPEVAAIRAGMMTMQTQWSICVGGPMLQREVQGDPSRRQVDY